MKPAPFEYHDPETVADVVALLDEHGDDARLLAGGQSLVPMLALRLTRFPHLVDLNRVQGLRGVERRDGELVVKAMTTQRAAEQSPEVEAVPLLARALPFIGHFQIRNRGTVGGSLAHADPAAELPAVALALDAGFGITSAEGERTEAARDFFVGTWTTSLAPGEVLTEIRFPVWNGRSGFVVDEVARRSGDFALAGVTCAVQLDADDTVARCGIAMFGMSGAPIRCDVAEAALVGRAPSDADLVELGELAVRDADPVDDIHASSSYRRAVGARIVTRALGRALEEARGD